MADVTYTIPDAKLADFKLGMLKVHPNSEVDGNGDPQFTDNAWLKEVGRRWFLRQYRVGKGRIADEANSPVIDNEVIA